jgi:hypothetical protein
MNKFTQDYLDIISEVKDLETSREKVANPKKGDKIGKNIMVTKVTDDEIEYVQYTPRFDLELLVVTKDEWHQMMK